MYVMGVYFATVFAIFLLHFITVLTGYFCFLFYSYLNNTLLCMYIYVNRLDKIDNYYSSVALFHYGGCLRVVLNYETKSKRNERNETKRNITKRNEIY